MHADHSAIRCGFSLGLVLVIASLASHLCAAEQPATATEPAPPRGTLVILGGSERFADAECWSEFVAQAGGAGARIAIIPAATNDPLRWSNWVSEVLLREGAKPITIPLGWREFPLPPEQVATDPQWVREVDQSTGVYLVGGDQDRLMSALHPGGERSPLLEAIWSVYRRGGVVAGTSAGAAVMSRVMFSDPGSVLTLLNQGTTQTDDLAPGLGLLDSNWFVDQHCLVRGRFPRSIVAMNSQQIPFGFGIDENTGLVIPVEGPARVIGHKGVLVFDLTRARQNVTQPRFNMENVRLTYLDRGDRFDMETHKVLPSAEKQAGVFLDPDAPDFEPASSRELVVGDILGNTAVVDLLGRLLHSANNEAIGLAFDAAAARRTPESDPSAHVETTPGANTTPGFEFRFQRDERTHGWYTEGFGGDDYTVVSMRLDIQPMQLQLPLYELAPLHESTTHDPVPTNTAPAPNTAVPIQQSE